MPAEVIESNGRPERARTADLPGVPGRSNCELCRG